MRKLILILITFLVLVGCNPKELDQVSNLRLEEQLLKWDVVNNADEYIVRIGEIIKKTTEAELELQSLSLDSGEYTVTIYAKAQGFKESKPKEFTINYTAPVSPKITNLRVEANVLKWNSVEGESYIVSINSEEFTIDVSEFSLSELEENKFYEIKVRASRGEWSDTYNYETFVNLDEVQYSYNKYISENLSILLDSELIKITTNNSSVLDSKNYQLVDANLIVKKDFLSNIKDGNYSFVIYTTQNKFNITINVFYNNKPYMITNNVVEFTGEDLEFVFELLNGTITQVTGNTITSEDYLINENKLVIKKEFISKVLNNDQARISIILNYQLTANTDHVLGSIEIKKG